MNILIYAGVAVSFLVLVLSLVAGGRALETPPDAAQMDTRPAPGEDRWLTLAERIFDPGDARWLREELAFPELAESLTKSRRQLAIRWLKALQASFNEFVRTPAMAAGNSAASSLEGWRLLWLTLRFQFLLYYALLVVRVYGPYHRLIPLFARVPNPVAGWPRLKPSVLASTSKFR